MTNEEVIRMLVRIKERINFEVTNAQEKMDALNIAIKALEQSELNLSYNSVKTELEPCEDEYIEKYEAIRRIELRRKITCESDPYNYEEWTKGYEEGIDDAIAMINSVPSVTPTLEQTSHLTDRPCEVCEFHSDNGCSKWKCIFEEGTK